MTTSNWNGLKAEFWLTDELTERDKERRKTFLQRLSRKTGVESGFTTPILNDPKYVGTHKKLFF